MSNTIDTQTQGEYALPARLQGARGDCDQYSWIPTRRFNHCLPKSECSGSIFRRSALDWGEGSIDKLATVAQT